ncbi:MAG: ATP-binding protein [Rhodospirillaceae bacterium]|nr:ATP-binding protein [Rhodospirillaceae bacterium]
MIFELTKGVALLLALSSLQYVVAEHWQGQRNRWRDLASGGLFGAISVAGMLSPIEFAEGFVLDPRSVVLTMAGVFAGPCGAAVAAAMSAAMRIWMGGDGAINGLAVIATSTLFGLGYRALMGRGLASLRFLPLLGLGVIVHLVIVGQSILLAGDVVLPLVDAFMWPYMLVYSIAAALLGLILRTIEEGVQARLEVRESRGKLRYLFDTVPMSICVNDMTDLYPALDGLRRQGVENIRAWLRAHPREAYDLRELIHIRDANKAALSLFEATSTEQIRISLRSRMDDDDLDAFNDLAGAIWDGLPLVRSEVDFRTFSGRRITVILSIPLPTDPAARSRIPISIVDITERKRSADALAAAKAEAERANHAKSDFLAAVSHDLRTPLNAIVGFSELMLMEAHGSLGSPRYATYAQDILSSGKLLVSIVDDILDLAKVEAGRFVLSEETVSLCEVVEASVAQVRHMAQEKQQTIAVSCGETDWRLRADRRILQQVLNNLLSNAIKFSPQASEVRLTVARQSDRSTEIAVTDQGVGMSPDELEQAFRPFRQFRESVGGEHRGTGLGLFLCLRFMKLHDGHLTLESQPGQGTRAIVRFPPARAVA